MKNNHSRSADLGMLSMAAMITTTVLSLRGLAAQSVYGYTSIFWYVFASLFFLVPFALVCAELASTYTKRGGIFRWCGQAFGPRWGWVAIYLEWVLVVIWLPSVLMFCAVALSYVFGFENNDGNKLLTLALVLAIYWGCTLNCRRGIGRSAKVAALGGLMGTIVPGVALIVLAAIYLIGGGENHIDASQAFLPDFSRYETLVLSASIFLFYGGLEMQAVHVNRMRNPQRNYPRAVLLAGIVILCVFILGTLAIGMVTSLDNFDLLGSLLQAYNTLWAFVGLPWMGRVMAVLIAFGVISQVSIIISGPSTGLLEVGRAGYLPRFFQRTNNYGVHVNILVVQGCAVSAVSCVLIILPSVQSAYQIISQMSTIVYLLLCGLIYASFVRLRAVDSLRPRGFRVPGKKGGAVVILVVGLAGLLYSGALSFLPPSQISVGSPTLYVAILAVGTVVLVVIPFLIFAMKRPQWRDPDSDFEPFD